MIEPLIARSTHCRAIAYAVRMTAGGAAQMLCGVDLCLRTFAVAGLQETKPV